MNIVASDRYHIICPECGHEITNCQIPGCMKVAVYEGWQGHGHIRRVKVCEEHAKELRGWEKHKEKMEAE